MPSCGCRVRSSAPAAGWCIGCCRGIRGKPSSSACSTSCAVDATNLEVGVRTLRPTAAMWTEEAEGGDHDRLDSDAVYGSEEESEDRRVLKCRPKPIRTFACLRTRTQPGEDPYHACQNRGGQLPRRQAVDREGATFRGQNQLPTVPGRTDV